MHTLQTLVFPNLEVHAPEEMYLRLNDRSWADLGTTRLHFEAGGTASSDTFFNGLTVATWKRHCDIRTLVLCLEGSGEFVVTLGLQRFAKAGVWLSEHEVVLSAGQTTHLPVRAWEGVADGLLYFRIRALGPGVLERADYVTPDEPPNDVRLGLVITHFNRQAQVLPAIGRICRSLLDRDDLQGRVTLTVVDNSRNLSLPAHAGVELIANRNLGGTGGFVRGLLALIDSGRHTHALFMDDDASCEPESIARTHALLRYARTPRLAVAGALLSESHPWHLLEKGAQFKGECKPLHAGGDMRRVDALLWAERLQERPDYGGWWFFAFAIADIERFPFPFFVRGDDVMFSLTNRFQIVTMNGVACFGEEFSLKHGPMTAYLDARYHLLHGLLDPAGGTRAVLRLARGHFLRPLQAYHYASARAVTLALRHLMQGPAFFREHLDMAQVRAEIGALTPNEKMLPLDRASFDVHGPRSRPEGRLRALVRLLTLQGFLLPAALLKQRMLVHPKFFHGDPQAVFRYRRVLYEDVASNTGYVAEYDRRRFFAELGDFARALRAFLQRTPALRGEFRRGFDDMATAGFWREVYGPAEVVPPTMAAAAAPDAAPAAAHLPTVSAVHRTPG